MKSMVAIALVGLIAVFAVPGTFASDNHNKPINRKLMTLGEDDFAAIAAVGQVGIETHLEASRSAISIAKAKKKEAFYSYKADKKVAEAMEDAMKHAAKYPPGSEKALKYAARDAKDIAEAVADAKELKIKAKMYSMKVVAKSVSNIAETKLKYGTKAAIAIGEAALNDAATFAPILAGLAPQVLPGLLSGLAAGPTGIQSALGGLAQAIGGALIGNIGLEGPDLLANRVAGLLPSDLLNNLPDLEIDIPNAALGGLTALGGGANGGSALEGIIANMPPELLDGLVANMPPQVLDVITNFLSGGNNNNGPSLPFGLGGFGGSDGDNILLPGEAIRTIVRGITNLMGGGRPLGIDIDLPNLPAAGLPFRLPDLSNLLNVLPQPDLLNIFRLLPRTPLTGLLRNLPLGLQIP